jgi:hypothetical protein
MSWIAVVGLRNNLNNRRISIMREHEPVDYAGPPLMAMILVPLGLVLIFAGLCLGLWVLQIAYTALYQPEGIPLVGKVLVLIDKDDAVIEQVNTDTGVRWEGAGVRYGVLMLLLIVVLVSIGSVIRGFISAGSSMIQAALGKPGTKDAGRHTGKGHP